MGSGATLANLRLDEGPIASEIKGKKVMTGKVRLGAMIGRDVRIGVNTSVMPGIKIGTHSLVGSGITIDGDIPADSFCVGEKSSYTVKKNTKTIDPTIREGFKKSL